ncbi:hypothetical protein GQ457_04G023150 [Hibiscus cannabinus]
MRSFSYEVYKSDMLRCPYTNTETNEMVEMMNLRTATTKGTELDIQKGKDKLKRSHVAMFDIQDFFFAQGDSSTGHTTEGCGALKKKVMHLIRERILSFEGRNPKISRSPSKKCQNQSSNDEFPESSSTGGQKSRTNGPFDPIPISYEELYPQLLEARLVVPSYPTPRQPPYPECVQATCDALNLFIKLYEDTISELKGCQAEVIIQKKQADECNGIILKDLVDDLKKAIQENKKKWSLQPQEMDKKIQGKDNHMKDVIVEAQRVAQQALDLADAAT